MGPALLHNDSGLILSLRKPMRHHDVIREAARAGIPPPIGGEGWTQGFMTIFGFKDRTLTGRILNYQGHLTSENLW